MDLALKTLIGREPTTEEITKFYKLRDLLGISEHDAMWTFLLAYGHYEILYREIPGEIAEQTRQLLADHKFALDATAQAAERLVRNNLGEAVAKAASDAIEAGRRIGSETNGHLPKRRAYAYVAAAVLTSFFVILATGTFAYNAGEKAGAHAAALDADWARSPQGIAAKEFAGLNPVQTMLDCASNFQIRKEANATYCIPYDPKTKLTTGWRIK